MKTFKWYLSVLPAKIKASYLFFAVFYILCILINLYIPITQKNILDAFQKNDINGLLSAMIVFIVISVVSLFFFYMQNFVYRHISSCSVSFFMDKAFEWSQKNKDKTNPEIIINDSFKLNEIDGLITGIINILKIPLILIIIFMLDKVSFIIGLFSIGIWYGFIKTDRKLVDIYIGDVIEKERNNYAFMEDSIGGNRDIKAMNSIEKEYGVFASRISQWYLSITTYYKKRYIKLFAFELIKIILMGFFIVSAFYGLYSKKYLIGTVFALLSYYGSLDSPIADSFRLSSTIGYMKKSILNLKNIFDMQVIEESGDNINGEIINIEFNNVSFAYEEKEVLKDLSLKINKGEKIALVGKSGEGKSTVLKLLMGMEKTQKGQININKKDVDNISKTSLYSKIGILSQNSYIFNRSIKDNITLGRDVDKETLEKALKISGVKEFIGQMPDGIDTPAGQAGNFISGGQRVRIALARLIVSDPEIIVLDEPLEGVDKLKEEEVVNNIKEYIKEKTVIIISHRFSILSMAERFVVLEEGKVSFDDRFENLSKKETLLKDFIDAENRMKKNFIVTGEAYNG